MLVDVNGRVEIFTMPPAFYVVRMQFCSGCKIQQHVMPLLWGRHYSQIL